MAEQIVSPVEDPTAPSPPSDRGGPQQRACRLADEAVARGGELRLEELIEHAHALGPDPALADLDDESLVRSFVVHSAQLAAASARWLALLAELVIRDVWADQGPAVRVSGCRGRWGWRRPLPASRSGWRCGCGSCR